MAKHTKKGTTTLEHDDAAADLEASPATGAEELAPESVIAPEATPLSVVAGEEEPAEEPFTFDVAPLTDRELNAAFAMLRGEVRRRLEAKQSIRPKVGSKVRILRGPDKYVGKVGTAVIVRKTRCFVTVPEINAPAYVLISDMELLP